MVKSSKSGSKKGFYLLIAVVAVAGIGTLSYMSGRSKASAPITLNPNLPPVTSAGYVMGSATAPLEVIEFGDFECPACNQFAEITEPDVRAQLVNTGKLRFRFIDIPLSMHRNTLNASVAAACADEQGQFWPLHDLLYSKQDQWNGESTDNPDKVIKALAHTLPGLDAPKFDECLDSRRTLSKVQAHMKLGDERGVRGTPTFVIGSKMYNSVMGIDAFKQAVNEALAEADTAKPAATKTKPTGKTKKP